MKLFWERFRTAWEIGDCPLGTSIANRGSSPTPQLPAERFDILPYQATLW